MVTDGTFSLTRNGPAGTMDSLTDGTASLVVEATPEGLFASRRLTVAGSVVADFSQVHDTEMKVATRLETVAGSVRSLAYGYDLDGRLGTVTRGVPRPKPIPTTPMATEWRRPTAHQRPWRMTAATASPP